MIIQNHFGKLLKYLFSILLIRFFSNTIVSADYSNTLPYSFYTVNVNNIIYKDLNFENAQTGENSDNWLYMKFNSTEYKTMFWNNGKIYFYANGNTYFYQGYYDKTCLIYSETGSLNSIGCQEQEYQDISIFYDLQNYNFTNVYIYPEGGLINFCIYNSNTKYYYCFNASMLTGSLNIPENTIDFTRYVENSPFGNGTGIRDTFGSGNTETIPSDVENYIRYFEDLYGREESMCYVGVGDSFLDVPYGSGGISFAEGRGATIFGLYYHLYNTFGDNAVYNVGSFINAWTNNLYNTYKSDPYYIQYNGPGDNTTVIYTGSFPFLNQPVAIYFMADNLNSYDNTENNGQGVVVYCDIKLNKDNYENGSLDFSRIEDIIPDHIKNNVKNYTNTSVGGKDGYSTPDLGSGSIWGNFVQSGYNIPKDLNPTDLFSDFYGKINGLITNFNPAVRDGLIPLWIIYPMLFLILFRIMRH